MDCFTYAPIDLDRPGFRLFLLYKGPHGSSISGELFEAWFDRPESVMPFDALSYTWGSSQCTEEIALNNKQLSVTNSLYLALKYLRLEDCDRILWIDAICIDQNNPTERGHQVQQMGHIYQTAIKVICWLGLAEYETKVLMKSLKLLQQHSIRQANCDWSSLWSSIQPILAEDHPDLPNIQQKGFQKLLNSPWFERIWIVQEVASARAAEIWCGKQAVSTRIFGQAPKLLQATVKPQCEAVLDIMPGPLRRNSWWSESRDLYNLLKKFRKSKALDPRDKIFALLGISSDMQQTPRLVADYTKSTTQIIKEVSQYFYSVDVNPPTNMEEFLDNLELLNTKALETLAASPGGIKGMHAILQRGEDAKISEVAVLAAAKNETQGKEIMDMFSNHKETNFPISRALFVAAAANNATGGVISDYLLRRVDGSSATKEFFEAATICLNMVNRCSTTCPPYQLSTADSDAIQLLWDVGGQYCLEIYFEHSKYLSLPIPSKLMVVLWTNWAEGGKEIIDTYLQQQDRCHDPGSEVAIRIIGDKWSSGVQSMFDTYFYHSPQVPRIISLHAAEINERWGIDGRDDIMDFFKVQWSLSDHLTLKNRRVVTGTAEFGLSLWLMGGQHLPQSHGQGEDTSILRILGKHFMMYTNYVKHLGRSTRDIAFRN